MLSSVILIISVATTTSEWVEISQQYYRKPVRFTHNPTSDVTYEPFPERSTQHHKGQFDPEELIKPKEFIKPNYDIEVQPNRSPGKYTNVSITDTWSRNKYRVPANIQRIHIDKPDEEHVPYLDAPQFVTKNVEKDKVAATVERVSNIGSVKRVHLSDTPVKSPTVNDISKTNKINSFLASIKDYSDEFEYQSDILKDDHTNVKIPNGIKPSGFETTAKDDKIITSSEKPTQNVYHIKKIDSAKYEINKLDANKKISDTEKDISNTDIQQTQATPSENFIDSDIDKILKFDKHKHQIKKVEKTTEVKDDNFEEVTQNNKVTKLPNMESQSQEQSEGSSEVSSSSQEKTKPGDINMQTMENLMKFMKVVTETISRNTKRGVHGKVKYLNELKDTLLNSIKSRIDATWPDEDTGRRRSRSTARGHVEFPSSESSLMTISFLTFAVFLIKLVLQVIQTYKNKTMVMAPLVVATAGRAVKKLRNIDRL